MQYYELTCGACSEPSLQVALLYTRRPRAGSHWLSQIPLRIADAKRYNATGVVHGDEWAVLSLSALSWRRH